MCMDGLYRAYALVCVGVPRLARQCIVIRPDRRYAGLIRGAKTDTDSAMAAGWPCTGGHPMTSQQQTLSVLLGIAAATLLSANSSAVISNVPGDFPR